ncbi:MAG: hypothetical protein DMG31_20170 [Acidobacteria bacterium]|nr:MAG: hypothetical protein DMG31_20170 [Acidobacteriota bacterium]
MAADGVIVAGDNRIGFPIRDASIHGGNKLCIRVTCIPQFGKTRAADHSLTFRTMPRDVKDNVVGYARQPHGRRLTCVCRQLTQADKLYNGAFSHSGAKKPRNGVAFCEDAMARARHADQFDAALFAHSPPARDQKLLYLIIVDLISVKLLDAIGMHAGRVKGGHIGWADFIAAGQ